MALIVLATLAAYHNSFDAPLVFDDVHAIAENPTIRSEWSLRHALSPPANSGLGGRPLANLSFALNHAWGGMAVAGYHAVNLALHLASALLLFGVIRRTLAGRSATEVTPVATVAALLWAAHPVNTAAVTYLSQRTELMMGFFCLVTLYAFLRGWFRVAVAACALGMMSKETMVVAPLLVLLLDRTFLGGSFAAAWRSRRNVYLGLAATWLIAGWLLTTGLSARSVGYGLGVSTVDYGLNACRALLVYAKVVAWPAWLVFDYGRDYAVSVPAVIGALGIAIATAWLLWRRPVAGFVAAAVLLLLAPTTSVVPVVEQPMAENRIYLPLAVLAVAMAVSANAVIGRKGLFGLVVASIALVVLTVARNHDFCSGGGIWADTVLKRPTNPRAHYNHGVVLLNAGQTHGALRALRESVRLRPDDAQARTALGGAFLRAGDAVAAEQELSVAMRLQPELARAWYHAGVAAVRLGELGEARTRLERALALDPRQADPQNELGSLETLAGADGRALERYLEALRLDPSHAEARYNAGSACFELGRFDEAVRHFSRAVELSPRDAELRNFHGAALLRAGRPREGIAEFEAALRLDPRHTGALENLALARETAAGRK